MPEPTAPNLNKVCRQPLSKETAFFLAGTWAGSWDELAEKMDYSAEERAKRRYNRIKKSLCKPASSFQIRERPSPHNNSASDKEEAEDLSQNRQQLSLATYTAAELSAMITKSGAHSQALKSELEIKTEIAAIENKIKAEEERLKREQDFLDGRRSCELGRERE